VQNPHWKAVILPERLLHRVQLAVPRETFDSGYFRTVRLDSEDCAGF